MAAFRESPDKIASDALGNLTRDVGMGLEEGTVSALISRSLEGPGDMDTDDHVIQSSYVAPGLTFSCFGGHRPQGDFLENAIVSSVSKVEELSRCNYSYDLFLPLARNASPGVRCREQEVCALYKAVICPRWRCVDYGLPCCIPLTVILLCSLQADATEASNWKCVKMKLGGATLRTEIPDHHSL